jgi:hypothetical protein
MTTATPNVKIVIVDGNRFPVAIETDNEAIRAHLANTYPMVSTATIQKGKETIEGVEYQTIEFVKKVGTKGSL